MSQPSTALTVLQIFTVFRLSNPPSKPLLASIGRWCLNNLKKGFGDNRQVAYQLLSNCIFTISILLAQFRRHSLRILLPSLISICVNCEGCARYAARALTNLCELHLPLRAAGIGLVSLEDIMPLAYYASWARCGSKVSSFFASLRNGVLYAACRSIRHRSPVARFKNESNTNLHGNAS